MKQFFFIFILQIYNLLLIILVVSKYIDRCCHWQSHHSVMMVFLNQCTSVKMDNKVYRRNLPDQFRSIFWLMATRMKSHSLKSNLKHRFIQTIIDIRF